MAFHDSFPKNMQTQIGYLILVLVFGLILASLGFAFYYFVSAWDKAFDTEFPRQISVQGEGRVAVKPDTAIFTAGVVTSATKIKDAQDENTRKSNAITEFSRSQGVDEKDIKTAGYMINPQYQYDSRPCIQVYPNLCPPQSPPRISSYEVRHTLEVKVHDLTKIDELLDGVVKQGANEVGSVQFKVDDEEKVLEEARKKAIEDARKRAHILEDDLGIRLTRITSFNESGRGIPPYALYDAFGKGGGEIGAALPATPEITPGEQEVRSFVNITYEFK